MIATFLLNTYYVLSTLYNLIERLAAVEVGTIIPTLQMRELKLGEF